MAFSPEAWEIANRDKRRAQKAAAYRANRETRLLLSKAYNDQNSEKIKADKKLYYTSRRVELIDYQKAWNRENQELRRISNRRYDSEHPEQLRTRSRNRAARVRDAEGSHTASEIEALAKKQKYRCANQSCRASIRLGYHVDHVMPLALGGSNFISNIQLLCRSCNLRKSAKHPLEWARENGLLL